MAFLSVALLSPAYPVAVAQQTPAPDTAAEEAPTQAALPDEEASKIPNDQLDSLVAPIALYPDPLLSQTLVASTYPLEIVQLQQWLGKNENLKGKELADAVEKQPWDPSIQAMAALPTVVKQLGDNIAWTSELGNAFLAQESDVMDAVQRMRAKAESTGTLKTSQEQTVETKQVEGKSVVEIQPADPDVVYVPSYNPTVVYGAPAYPYPPIYYPPVGAYVAGAALSFGVGVAVGSFWGHGGWGWGCGWGHNDINVNVNNRYVNNYNRTNVNNRVGKNGTWQHNPQHRGGAPYPNRNVANKYPSAGNRPGASNRPGGGAGNVNRPGGGAANRPGGGTANRPGGGAANRPGGGAANRPGGGTANRPGGGTANRPGGGTANRPGGGTANRPGGGTANRASAGNRPSGGGTHAKPATRPSSSGGANHIGNRQVSRTPSSRNKSAFSGASSGMNRSSAHASHNRGSRSMGGGGHRGGGRRR
ncbi:MAG: DUF3300 domain-containing protein [Chthoniobacterales bacterium]